MQADAAVLETTVEYENAHQNLMANMDLEELGSYIHVIWTYG